MKMKSALNLVALIAFSGLLLLQMACSQKKVSTAPAGNLTPLSGVTLSGWESGSSAGISWAIPATWELGPPAPMRAGTYFAAPAGSDQEAAECRVNYFGEGQGGGVEQNVVRWVGQMEVDGEKDVRPEPAVSTSTVNQVEITVVEISGTYLSRMRPMAPDFRRKPGFIMFGAIVAAPGGTVFFKMTGAAQTMENERERFRQMLGSVRLSEADG